MVAEAFVDTVWDELDSLIGKNISKDEVRQILEHAAMMSAPQVEVPADWFDQLGRIAARNTELAVMLAGKELLLEQVREWALSHAAQIPGGLFRILKMESELVVQR